MARDVALHRSENGDWRSYIVAMEQTPTTVIYNDSCPVCSREVAGYMAYSRKRDLPVTYEPLTSCDLAQYGLTPDMAARRFYALKDGQMYDGIPAFAVLWAEMPAFAWLSRLVRLPVLRLLAAAFYDYILSPILYGFHKRRQKRLGNFD